MPEQEKLSRVENTERSRMLKSGLLGLSGPSGLSGLSGRRGLVCLSSQLIARARPTGQTR